MDKALDTFRSAADASADGGIKAESFRHMADAHRSRCEWDEALGAARRSAELAKDSGRPDLFAEALNAEALVHLTRGNLNVAAPLLTRMLDSTSDERIRGLALQNLGFAAVQAGDLETAETRFRESHECFETTGYVRGSVIALINRAGLAQDMGRLDEAEAIWNEAIAAARRIDDLELAAVATFNYAEALARKGDYVRAEEYLAAALGFFSIAENRWRRIECLRLLGDIRIGQGNEEHAARCYREGLQLARQIGAQVEMEQLQERLRGIGFRADPDFEATGAPDQP